MKTLELNQMEVLEGGASPATRKAKRGLEAACILGGIAMGLLSGPAFAAATSLTIHACIGYLVVDIEL